MIFGKSTTSGQSLILGFCWPWICCLSLGWSGSIRMVCLVASKGQVMLYSLSSDHLAFKALEFRGGLNIILADRMVEDQQRQSPERRTRNGAGKSSILDLIHFMLAGKPEGALTSEALTDWCFDLVLQVDDSRIDVRRGLR